MSTLTKQDIIEDIISNTGLMRNQAVEGVETTIDIIKNTLKKGEPLSLSGFGKFDIREKRDRRGRNPKTGEEIIVKARRTITFSLSNALRKKLEGER
jgi:integration host factor subunit alpha